MNFLRCLFLTSFFLSCTLFVSAQSHLPDNIRYVIAPSGLNVRAQASLDAPRLGKLSYGEEVEIIRQEGYLKVGNREGNWQQIEFEGRPGYIFNGYLSFLPAPSRVLTIKEGTMGCKDYEWFGPEPLLRTYVEDKLAIKGEPIQLLTPRENAEEEYHSLDMLVYEKGVVVFKETWYESSTMRMRVFGFTQAQALAFVEALLAPCKGTAVADQKLVPVKTADDEVVRYWDKGNHGGFITIHMIDYLTAEIAFSSGV